MEGGLSRRALLRAGAGGALALTGLEWAGGLQRALALAPRCGRLEDIEHVVILVQENRSFDHYFGTYRGVQGFSDDSAAFAQPGYDVPGYGGRLLPFHLDSNRGGECTADITHDWAPQHGSWNGGRMNGFVREHLRADGAANGPLTMGYYRRSDISYHHALADAFTLCDAYHCSVLGPTDPNQLYLSAATLDPDGRHGGPVLATELRSPSTFGTLTMTTMPEQLRARGISWKVYSAPDNLEPEGDSPFPLFRQYFTDPDLNARGIRPSFPADLQADAARGELPQVSWVYAPVVNSEHPPAPTVWGEWATDVVLRALTQDLSVWSRTVLFVTWDENGGFFDHVPPPVAPAGTPGEYVTVPTLPPEAGGVRGPIGLGFRVPLLIVSPFSRGGFVSSDRFDHTSLLRFVERRFGAEVPNLSAWRRAAVGDLTSAFNFRSPDSSIPALPAVSLTDPRVTTSNCPVEPAGLVGVPVPPYPVPPNSMPGQEPGTARRPSGLSCAGAPPHSAPHGHRRKHRRRRHRRRRRRRDHGRHRPRFTG
jgi:phospholipase C